MARMTLAQTRAHLEGALLRAEEAERKLAAINKTHVPVEEYNRVQGLLRVTQVQLATAQRGGKKASALRDLFEARRQAAKELAAQLGRVVSREEVLAYMEVRA